MAHVLAIEPDHRQATILKRLVREKVHADVAIVDTPDAALAAIRLQIPDVLLLSALLSPRDEDELIAHLRSLEGAEHIQTHTIPQLASSGAYQDDGERKGRSLLGVFKRKKDANAPVVAGCDPELFGDEIVTFLQRAAEKKAEGVAALQSRVDRLEYEVQQSQAQSRASAAATHQEPVADQPAADSSPPSSWASPFEWRRSPSPSERATSPEPASAPEPVFSSPEFTTNIAESIQPDAAPLASDSYVHSEPAAYAEETDYAAAAQDTPQYTPEPAAPAYSDPVSILEAEPFAAAPAYEAVHVEEPRVEEPAPRQRRRKGSPTGKPIAAETVLRLTPLAIWARSESAVQAASQTPEPRTATDELRSLIATLAVPAHVAGVSYGRGCRIRRVRVPGGKEKRKGDAPGPVILSRRTLEEQRLSNTTTL